MDEDVFRAFAAGQESKALGAVEPFHQRTLEPALRGHRHMGALDIVLSRIRRRRIVHRQDLEGLQATITLTNKADDARAFERGLEAVAAQAGHMKENVGAAAVRTDKAVALGHVKPFDGARDLDKIDAIVDLIAFQGRLSGQVPPRERGSVPHSTAPFSRNNATDS